MAAIKRKQLPNKRKRIAVPIEAEAWSSGFSVHADYEYPVAPACEGSREVRRQKSEWWWSGR
jgi:hypothetical protein